MRSNLRRSIAVAASVLVLVPACGGGDDDSSKSSEASESSSASNSSDGSIVATSAPSEESTGDGETLTVWTYYVGEGQLAALEAQNELFAETNPGVTVEHVQIPFDQLAPKLLAGVATGDGPDVVLDNVVVDFPALVESGALLDLSDYWSGYADAGQFPDSAIWESGDGIYNVMSYTNLLGMYYNVEVLERLGIEPPTTIDELEAAMQAVADDGQVTPLAMSGVASPEGAWMFMPILLGQDVNYCALEPAAVETALTQLQTWADVGFIPKETATWDQADAWEAFISGDYAFGFNGNWNLGAIDGASFTVGTALYPAGEAGSIVFPGGEGIGIGAFSDNPDLAWEYIQTAWMSADASLVNFKLSGQIPTRGDLADSPEVSSNELVAPFVEAATNTASWPASPNSAGMQNAMGQAVSGVISGSTSASDAAAQVVEDVNKEIADGGGDC